MILRMWNFCKVWVLSGYTQTHGIKGIPEISHPKTPYYFTDNSNINREGLLYLGNWNRE